MGKNFPSPLFPIPHGEKIRWGYVNPNQEGRRKAASTVLTLIMAFIEWRQLRLATPIAKKRMN